MGNKKYAEVYHTIGGKDFTMIDKKAFNAALRVIEEMIMANNGMTPLTKQEIHIKIMKRLGKI